MDPENQALEPPPPIQTPDLNPTQTNQQWESAAREWLASLPEGSTPTVTDVEAWVSSNRSTLPDRIISMPPQEIFQHFTSIQTSILPIVPPPSEEKAASPIEHPYRFQRSDVWKPVYKWLESFDTDNLIKSQEILDWLTENPEIREQLYVKHSRYHVMHYIKKCHIKILKRREKKKGVQPTNISNPVRTPKTETTDRPVPIPYSFAGNASNNLPKDSDLYATKRSEALQKYEILLELEKQLSVLFPNPQTVD